MRACHVDISRLALSLAMRRSLAGDASLAAHRRARDAAKEREELARRHNIEAARTRIEAVLLKGLSRELGDERALEGWTARFDLARVSGDPEGVQRGPRLNTRDKSILFVAPDGTAWKRQAVIEHFVAHEEPEQGGEEEEEEEESKPAAPVKEPPPVETDAGLAFEVDRILDVRLDDLSREPPAPPDLEKLKFYGGIFIALVVGLMGAFWIWILSRRSS